MTNYHVTKLQLELHKSIRQKEMAGLPYRIEQWKKKNAGTIKELKQEIVNFTFRYVVPMQANLQTFVKGNEDRTLYTRKDAPPRALISAYIRAQNRLVKLQGQYNLLTCRFESEKRALKKLNKINGSLKKQGVI